MYTYTPASALLAQYKRSRQLRYVFVLNYQFTQHRELDTELNHDVVLLPFVSAGCSMPGKPKSVHAAL